MYSASGTKAYAKIGVESAVMSASPDQLVTLLFDGALSALVRSRLFLLDGNIAGKGESLSKAINIIENGLKKGWMKTAVIRWLIISPRYIAIWCIACYRLICTMTAKRFRKSKRCCATSPTPGKKFLEPLLFRMPFK